MSDLLYLSQYFTTSLSVVGGIDASQTDSIVFQDVSGIEEPSKPGEFLLNYSDPLNESICEWCTYTSVNTTTKEAHGVVRGAEKGSAKAHDNGVSVAFPISALHINRINDKLTGVDPIVGATINNSTFNGSLIVTPIVKTSYDNSTLGATKTIDWSNGDLQTGTLDENVTLDFSNAVAGQRLTLFLLQDGTGTNTISFTPTIVWQDATTPTWTTTADKMNVMVIYYDGSSYYGMGAKFAA